MIIAHTMDHIKEPLPDYSNPPVVEVILGVQFERLANFRNAHLGAFWKSLDRKAWSKVADAPLLAPQFETFQPGVNWSKGVRVQLTQEPACRIQITNSDADRMIQVQNSRLHLNWLGRDGGSYPRFESVKQEFFKVFHDFTEFVTVNELGELRPNQWEITYLNHIPRGSVWEAPAEWNFFKPIAVAPKLNELVKEESFSGEWHYVIPQNRGRLHIEWRHAVKPTPESSPDEELIQLTLTGRGPIEMSDTMDDSISTGFGLGHSVIVCTFKNLMSDKANKFWGLKNACN